MPLPRVTHTGPDVLRVRYGGAEWEIDFNGLKTSANVPIVRKVKVDEPVRDKSIADSMLDDLARWAKSESVRDSAHRAEQTFRSLLRLR